MRQESQFKKNCWQLEEGQISNGKREGEGNLKREGEGNLKKES